MRLRLFIEAVGMRISSWASNEKTFTVRSMGGRSEEWQWNVDFDSDGDMQQAVGYINAARSIGGFKQRIKMYARPVPRPPGFDADVPRCPECHARLDGSPTRCPSCDGDVDYSRSFDYVGD
jgi:hypothetical protein